MLTQKPYTHDALDRVIDLLLAYRGAGYVRRYPTVWRLRLLIDSRLWDVEQDARLWENAVGDLCGFALLWKRHAESRFYGLERCLRPQSPAYLSEEILDWAVNRAQSASVGVLPLEIETEQDIALLETKGFVRGTEGYNVYMTTALTNAIYKPSLPTGFTLAPLEEHELAAYQAAYGFAPVTSAHQLALLHQAEYQHLTVKTAEGAFAGYLECSFSRDEWARSGQRIGWIDYIETQPDYQKRGLGEALMLAGFAHLQAQGADTVTLVTTSTNETAQKLFRKAGMQITGEDYAYQLAAG